MAFKGRTSHLKRSSPKKEITPKRDSISSKRNREPHKKALPISDESHKKSLISPYLQCSYQITRHKHFSEFGEIIWKREIFKELSKHCKTRKPKFRFARFQYKKDGYLVLEDFFTEEEVQEMREAGEKLTEDIPDESDRIPFGEALESKSKYLLESSDKIRYFFESGALGKDGKLLVDRKSCLNKVGHALHWLHPVFRKYTFCDKIKTVFDRILDFDEPCVVQSMYIYKNPKIGGEVMTHQDSSYLYTKPEDKLVGLWIALDDATVENGCLWFAPGSHNSGVHRRFIRNPDKTSDDLLIYTSPQPFYPSSNFKAVPVKKGSMILINGLVVHRSDPNRSDKPRHTYTFHVVDLNEATYSEENWLQPTEDLPFPNIYKNR